MQPHNEMTPESHMPGGPERVTPSVPSPEQRGIPYVPTPEQAPRPQESREQLSGRAAGDGAPAQALPTPMAPQPVAPAAPADDQVAAIDHPANDNPLAADDVDVIEKEWVDRAKKILQDTKDDPYQKEHEVSRLQADYLQKRFGVQVKLPQG